MLLGRQQVFATGGGQDSGPEGTNKTGADLNGLPRLNAPVIVYFREIRKIGFNSTYQRMKTPSVSPAVVSIVPSPSMSL